MRRLPPGASLVAQNAVPPIRGGYLFAPSLKFSEAEDETTSNNASVRSYIVGGK